jgi:hypothetical protein
VSWPGLVLAIGFAALAVRSAIHWGRRPFASTAVADHLLYALFVVSRVGLWASLAAWFLVTGQGQPEVADYEAERAAVEAARVRFWWIGAIFLVCAGLQFIASWFLGRRPEDPTPSPEPKNGSGGDAG